MKKVGAVMDGTQVTQKGEVEIRAGGQTVAKGGTGGMSTDFMFRNASTINDDVIIRAGENATIAGPISIGAENLTYTVTIGSVNGVNIFVIDGVNNPRLRMIEGSTYNFSNPNYSSHPISFINASTGSAYTTGVTDNQSSTGIITIVVAASAPQLRYKCTTHGNDMGNLIDIEASAGSLAVHGTLVIV